MAWTEPLFIVLVLLGFFLAVKMLENQNVYTVILFSLLTPLHTHPIYRGIRFPMGNFHLIEIW